MSLFLRIVHIDESKDYVLRSLWDGEEEVAPHLTWWGRAVPALDDPLTVEGGAAPTAEVSALLDDRLHPRWVERVREGATLDSCRLGRKPASYKSGAERSAVAAVSANFAPSKSISMLLVAGDESVARLVSQTHRQAVTNALNFLQKYADVARANAELAGLLGILDQRYSSKAWNPHLSTTATIVNAAPRTDGKWVAPDGRELLRWLLPMSSFIDAYLLRVLAAYPSLKVVARPTDGLPTIVSHAVSEETCQRYSTDSSKRRPLPTAPDLASVAYTSRINRFDLALPELQRRIRLDTEPVVLGVRQELPEGSDTYLHRAFGLAVERLFSRYSESSRLRGSHLVSAALSGLILAGPVRSSVEKDALELVRLLSEFHLLRDRVIPNPRFTLPGALNEPSLG